MTFSNGQGERGSQPPMTFDLSLSESAGSRSLHPLGLGIPDTVLVDTAGQPESHMKASRLM
jgi:hypothetical protein